MIFINGLESAIIPQGKRKKRHSVAFPLAIPIRLLPQPTEYPSPAVRACVSCAMHKGAGVCRRMCSTRIGIVPNAQFSNHKRPRVQQKK